MFESFPTNYEDVLDWSWEQFKPYADDLMARDVTEDSIDGWLRDWTQFTGLLFELRSRLNVAAAANTEDEEAETRYRNYVADIQPQMMRVNFALSRKLVDSEIVPEDMDVPMRGVRAEIELFREENLPLIQKLSDLQVEYGKISGSQTVEWDGEEKTLQQMRPVLQETDRDRREKAWYLMQERMREDREKYDELWVQYMTIRKEIYENAGFDNYREYAWKDRGRFDYTPEDAEAFCQAIEETVVPALARQREARRQTMGLDALRPWDTQVDPPGRDPLKPFETIDEFEETTVRIFQQVDPKLGEFFRTMKDERLLDLDNRKAKRPGGFCTAFPVAKRPFIFMNAVGVDGDIRVLLHEAGHAFHAFYVLDDMDYWQQGNTPMEFNEVASMAMELLAAPYLTEDRGGFFSTPDAARFRKDHLQGIIGFWPYMAIVVAFQHWIYTNHDEATDPANCDKKWRELWDRYQPGVDWSGVEDFILNIWRRQLHIFLVPFYYIEYGLAQLGAVQVWANALKDQQTALEQYRKALRLAGTVTLPELYEVAGAKLAFDSATLGEAVSLLETQINELAALEN